MKVHIAYTVDIGDDIREAINRYYGKPGMATRADVQAWYKQYGESMDMDLSGYPEEN